MNSKTGIPSQKQKTVLYSYDWADTPRYSFATESSWADISGRIRAKGCFGKKFSLTGKNTKNEGFETPRFRKSHISFQLFPHICNSYFYLCKNGLILTASGQKSEPYQYPEELGVSEKITQ